jgi:hypothetical protein
MAQTAKPLTARVYVPIRRCADDGHEWLDSVNLGLLPELAQEKADAIDREIPQWAKANPVVRIVRATITVEEE